MYRVKLDEIKNLFQTENKPWGKHAGEPWDLSKDEDIEELVVLVEREKPLLLTGSPPCDQFSQLMKISDRRCNPEKRRMKRALGVKHLKTAVRF